MNSKQGKLWPNIHGTLMVEAPAKGLKVDF